MEGWNFAHLLYIGLLLSALRRMRYVTEKRKERNDQERGECREIK